MSPPWHDVPFPSVQSRGERDEQHWPLTHCSPDAVQAALVPSTHFNAHALFTQPELQMASS
jgi:hypothetical protein